MPGVGPRHVAAALALLVLLGASGCASLTQPAPSPAAEAAAAGARDRARAEALYAEAQRALNPPAGTPRDPDRAAQLIEQAALLGHADAQMLLAGSYLFRPDGSRNPAAALPWLTRAAQQGHVEAQVQLARLTAAGDGTAKDAAWAAVWFQRAAERGSAESQFALALMQVAGSGTATDQAEALARLNLAEQGGVAEARRYRDALEARVLPDEAAAARDRLRRETARGAVPPIDRPLVRFAQHALKTLGRDPGPIDGRDGPATRAALSGFAHAENLPAGAPYGAAVITRLREKLPRA